MAVTSGVWTESAAQNLEGVPVPVMDDDHQLQLVMWAVSEARRRRLVEGPSVLLADAATATKHDSSTRPVPATIRSQRAAVRQKRDPVDSGRRGLFASEWVR